jgi:chemosensory pili system protein ChpC
VEPDEETVRCLALPIVGDQLLVPSAVVAEVFTAPGVSPVKGGPKWLLGSLFWRGIVLPLVCMETALGGERLDLGTRSKLVVMHGITGSESLRYYAVLLQGIPRQILATRHTVKAAGPAGGERPFVAAELQLDGEQASIPDLDDLEKALLAALDAWRKPGEGSGQPG